MDIKDLLFSVMVDTGRLSKTDRISIINVEKKGDYAFINVDCIKKRCKKPFMFWSICIWMPGNLIYWDRSRFQYL